MRTLAAAMSFVRSAFSRSAIRAMIASFNCNATQG